MAKDLTRTSFKAYGDVSGKDSKKNDMVIKASGENLTEDVLEKWIKESDISNDGKVNYHNFLRKMSQNKKTQTENFLYAEIEQDIQAEFASLDKGGTGFLWASDMKSGILKTLDKKFQELLNEASVEENVETTTNENLEAGEGKNISSESSEISEEVPLPSPPDGGWGWVIVFACFMCNLVINGFRFGGFGVLLAPLQEHFKAPISSLAWAGSLSCGLLSLLGPLIGGLINKFGLRPVCIAGSIVSSIGLCLATLSPDVPTLIFTMGAIAGVGYGLINLPAKVAIGYYFESKRALATGIAETGSGFGTFVFTTLLTTLATSFGTPKNDGNITNTTVASEGEATPEISEGANSEENLQQSWEAPVFFIAGLCFCCIIFGGLMRPLEFVRESEEEKKSSFSKSLKKKLGSALVPVTPKRLMSKRKPMIVTPFSKKCLLYGGAVEKLINDKKFPAWNECKNILIFNPKTPDCNDCPNQGNAGFWVVQKPKAKKSILPILAVLKEMVNVELFMDAKFVLFGLSVFFGILGLYVPYAYLPKLARDCIGKDSNDDYILSIGEANILLSIIGIANIVGKLVTGWLSDFRWVNTQALSNVLILICGIDILCMPLFHHLGWGDYNTFVFGAVVFGFCSSYVILKTIILVELLGLEKLTSAFGLLGIFEGVACVIGTPIAGAVYDATNRYYEPFYMAAGFFILASVLGFIVQAIDKRGRSTTT